MKQSKIQLVELNLERISLSNNLRYKSDIAEEDFDESNMALQSAKTIHKSPLYWDDSANVDQSTKDHTYSVKLGIRTPPLEKNGFPYHFEVMQSGVIVNFDETDGNSDDLAVKYGLALLYGAVRDQIFTLTLKMKRGQLLLPTMSFEDERYEDLLAAHEKLMKIASEKRADIKK